MEIKRVTEYNNPLFSQIVLNQRGAFLIDEEPYEIEIISSDSASVKGKNRENYVLCICKSFTGLTIACKQAIVEISPLRFALLNFGRDDLLGIILRLVARR